MPRIRTRRRSRHLDEEKLSEKREQTHSSIQPEAGRSHRLQHIAALQQAPLSIKDVESLQGKTGNRAVDRLLSGKIEGGAGGTVLQKAEDGKPAVPSLNGTPYYKPRKVNPKMDGFEAQQNLFGPLIFRQFVRDMALWKPLMRFVNHYWFNQGNEAGVSLQPEEQPAVWRLLNARLRPREMQIVKTLYKDARQENKLDVLLDAFWVEFRREYEYCHKKAEEAFSASSYLLRHEFYAAWFGLVEPPFTYLARKSA